MSAGRAVALACVGVGLLLGSLAPPHAVQGTRTIDGYTLLAGDFHVHSYPGDGALPPWMIASEARRRGLDVIALTNHNRVWPARLGGARLRGPASVLVIPGEEVTTPRGHLAAVGLTSPVGWNAPIERIVQEVHAQGGVAIAAHPGRDSAGGFEAALPSLDGAEVAHPMIFHGTRERNDLAAFYRRARQIHPTIAAIGSTDFHFWAPVGLCRTYLFVNDVSERGVLDAIRAGRTAACDAEGQVYGPLGGKVTDLCRADMSAALHANTRADTGAVVLVLAGLLGLIVL